MKKSIVFLINGLGIEKPGSYSIALDQSMPNLGKLKETSFFTTAFTNSLEYKSAYQQFFLGDTYEDEIEFIKNNVLTDEVVNNQTYQNLYNTIKNTTGKIHVFIDPTNEKVVDLINGLCTRLEIPESRPIYLHLLLSHQSVVEYKKIITMVNYIKYNINTNITVGFVFGKEFIANNQSKTLMSDLKKTLFFCSCERWTNTEDKLNSLMAENIPPCKAPGFCATNSCSIVNGDVILFFNTRRDNFDDYINAIFQNAPEVFKTDQFNLPIFSLIKLFSKYEINYLCEKINYDHSFANVLARNNKKALILTDKEHIELVNFDANGLEAINNPNIQFMFLDQNLENKEVIENIIDKTGYDVIIFDYHMDVSRTIVDLKVQLENIDKVLGNIGPLCENRHSLFITSLFGLKKELPVAEYNAEMVTLDYQDEIPIFFYDYTFPRSKYGLRRGETHLILNTAMSIVSNDPTLETLITEKGLGGLFKKLK